MKRLCLSTLVLALVVGMTTAVQAQRPEGGQRGGNRGPGGMGLLSLASQKSVSDELKLTAEQTEAIKKLADKQREGSRAGGENQSREERFKAYTERAKASEAALGEVLKPEQVTRLKQIGLQLQGGMAFNNPAVAESLKLTDEQKEKIKGIQEESMKSMRAMFESRDKDANRDEARKKFETARDAAKEKLMGVLTSEQAAKWKEMTGEPFKGEIHREFRGQRGGGPRGGDSAPRKEA